MATWPMVQVCYIPRFSLYMIQTALALGCVNSVQTFTSVCNLHIHNNYTIDYRATFGYVRESLSVDDYIILVQPRNHMRLVICSEPMALLP